MILLCGEWIKEEKNGRRVIAQDVTIFIGGRDGSLTLLVIVEIEFFACEIAFESESSKLDEKYGYWE